MRKHKNILIVDDRSQGQSLLKRVLEEKRRDIITVGSLSSAIKQIDRSRFDLVVSDWYFSLDLDKENTAAQLLMHVRQKENPPPVIIMTSFYTPEIGSEARRLGAYDYILRDDLSVDYVRRLRSVANEVLNV